MAAGDPRVEIDEAAIAAMIREWDSPVGRALQDATQIVEDTARIAAPVSPKGSKLAPIGFLKANTRQSLELHKDAEGVIMGLVGAASYPYNFIANPTGRRKGKTYTWNRGRQTTRPGDNNYLDDALNSLEGFVRYVGLLWPASVGGKAGELTHGESEGRRRLGFKSPSIPMRRFSAPGPGRRSRRKPPGSRSTSRSPPTPNRRSPRSRR